MDFKRVGYYCWGGPGTSRMINLKYFNPRLNIKSIESSYDYDYLLKIKEVFGVTDFWATYSWGFDNKTEEEDRQFLFDRLPNFKKADIKVHAYIQGPNVVYDQFREKRWYAKDATGKLIPYYRGRKVVCINNPEFLDITLQKIKSLKNRDIQGVFIDNIQMGQMGFPKLKKGEPFAFVGCTCEICRNLFFQRTGESIPLDFERDKERAKEYLQFRVDSTTKFIKEVADLSHSMKMEFGTNSFDPKFKTTYMFGTSLRQLAQYQDYLLFETHNLPRPQRKSSASYIGALTKKYKKPVFHISYRYGIGYDAEFSQADINYTFTEADHYGYYPLIKGSEYVTKGIWHNLNIDQMKKPQRDLEYHPHLKPIIMKYSTKTPRLFRKIISRRIGRLYTIFMESRLFRKLFGWLYSKVV